MKKPGKSNKKRTYQAFEEAGFKLKVKKRPKEQKKFTRNDWRSLLDEF